MKNFFGKLEYHVQVLIQEQPYCIVRYPHKFPLPHHMPFPHGSLIYRYLSCCFFWLASNGRKIGHITSQIIRRRNILTPKLSWLSHRFVQSQRESPRHHVDTCVPSRWVNYQTERCHKRAPSSNEIAGIRWNIKNSRRKRVSKVHSSLTEFMNVHVYKL